MGKEQTKCDICDGNGWYADHDSPSSHGECGECISCPVQVQCEKCLGTGFINNIKTYENRKTNK